MLFLQKLVASLLGLGIKRLLLLGVVAITISSFITLSVYSFRAPVRSILYSKLDKADVSAIGAALSEVGMSFDVNEVGDAVLVDFGKTAQARMLLAERGLPKSDKSGYELFDQMGSLGLTSFMQQVTKVRALEGELVRTIQQLDGIKSARVHLALKADGVLRNKDSRPTASVLIRVDGTPRENIASTIRHIVAAAIPGLQADQVMVSTTDGKLLMGSRSSEDSGTGELLDLETRISDEIGKRVTNTLEPFAGAENIRVSVSTTINLDKRQINETKYDPNSKVERSSFVVKSTDTSKEAASAPSVSVDQNIPQEVKPAAAGGDSSSKKKEDKQETVNYEVNSKQTATVSAGYIVERLSVAVVVNKKAVLNSLPAGSDAKELASRLAEVEAIVRSAAGFVEARGDVVTVSAIDFFVDDIQPDQTSQLGVKDYIAGNLGTIINAVSLIVAILAVLLLGLRPALKILVTDPRPEPTPLAVPTTASSAALMAPQAQVDSVGIAASGLQTAAGARAKSPTEHLNTLVDVDVDRAAQVLKKWLNDAERSAA
jgi:flagellar M-ring protein FliF